MITSRTIFNGLPAKKRYAIIHQIISVQGLKSSGSNLNIKPALFDHLVKQSL